MIWITRLSTVPVGILGGMLVGAVLEPISSMGDYTADVSSFTGWALILSSGIIAVGLGFFVSRVSRQPIAKAVIDRFPATSLAWTVLIGLVSIGISYEVGRIYESSSEWLLASPYWYFSAIGVVSGLAAGAVICFWLAALRLIASLSYSIGHTKSLLTRPDTELIDHLFAVICHATWHASSWNTIWVKRTILHHLELSARCVESYMPRALKSLDPVTTAWQRERADLVAGAMRDTKRWVIAPTLDTREYFLERMCHSLACILRGDWDSVHRLDPQSLSKIPSALARLQPLAVGLLRGGAILAIAIGLTQLPIGGQSNPLVTGTMAGYVLAAALIYMALNLMMVIDPQLDVRVSTARDIITLFLGSSDRGDRG